MRTAGTVIRLCVALTVIAFLTQHKIYSAEGPVDIYNAAGVKCVAAYSTVRALSSTYDGPLYQVRKTGGGTQDVGQTDDGFANAKDQDDFLGSSAGTISKLYDQSGQGNDLTVAKKGAYTGTAGQNNRESNAKAKSLKVNGHKVYALYTNSVEGYRSNQENYSGYPASTHPGKGMPTGNEAQGIYALEDGSRPNVGCCCCFDFGNASVNNAAGATGAMNTLFFGVGYWGKGAGSGPWFLNDMEAGVWAGGSGASGTRNNNLPSSKFDFAFGITKTSTDNNIPQYAITVANGSAADGKSPQLVNAYKGRAPSAWKMHGGIVLGIGGDNSNSSSGTFYEGCITAGQPSDATDELILQNILDAGYGRTTTKILGSHRNSTSAYMVNACYYPSISSAIINFTMPNSRHVSMTIYNSQGRRIATILDGSVPEGRNKAVWDAKQASAGVYVCKTSISGLGGWSEKIIVGK
jgi:hypothetical protein